MCYSYPFSKSILYSHVIIPIVARASPRQTDENRKTGWQESILALRSCMSLVASPCTTLTSHFLEAGIAFKVKCNPTATLEIRIAELWKPCCFWQQQYPQLCTIHFPYSIFPVILCCTHTLQTGSKSSSALGFLSLKETAIKLKNTKLKLKCLLDL